MWQALAQRALRSPLAKPVVWVLWLLPLAWLLIAAFTDRLGPNPAEALIRATGDWALRALWLALTVTPVRVLLGLSALARLRRLLGLFAFFYAALHLLSYLWLDMGWSAREVLADTLQRPFILVGMLTLLGLAALAATSPGICARALGARRWKQLHRLVYVLALLALLHFYWMRTGKNDTAEVGVYAALLALLLGVRGFMALRQRKLHEKGLQGPA